MEKKKLIEIANLRQYFPVKKESLLQKEQLYVKANDGITITTVSYTHLTLPTIA